MATSKKKTTKKKVAKKTTKASSTKKTTKKTTKASGAKKTTKKKKPAKRLTALDQMEAVLRKNKKLDIDDMKVNLDTSSFKKPLPHQPTGSVCIDFLIGGQVNDFGIAPCPGLPRGKMTQVYGWNSSGKSTLCLTAAATTIAQGGNVLYLDFENEVDPAYAQSLGVPIGNDSAFKMYTPDTLEQGFAILLAAASCGVDLIVIDSVAAGITKAMADLKQEDLAQGKTGRLGQTAAAWSWFLPMWKPRVARSKCAVIGVSQLRRAPAQNEPTVAGGEAWKFYTSVRIKLARIGWEKTKLYDAVKHKVADDIKTGAVIRATLDKCKVSRAAGQSQDFYIVHGRGIDDEHSILDIAAAHGVVKKSGSWLAWDDNKFQGTHAALEFLRNDRDAFEDLYMRTIPHLTGAQLARGDEENPPEDFVEPDEDLSMDELDAILDGTAAEIASEDEEEEG